VKTKRNLKLYALTSTQTRKKQNGKHETSLPYP